MAVVAAVYLLFAAANVGLGELGEATAAAVGGLSVVGGIVLVIRRTGADAAKVVAAGTGVLTVWFMITVPLGWSDPPLLVASLPTPFAALVCWGVSRSQRTRDV